MNSTNIKTKKPLRFVVVCKCGFKRVVDTPGTSTSHELLTDLGFVLIDGVYTCTDSMDCINPKNKSM
jgi:hypothetical protein